MAWVELRIGQRRDEPKVGSVFASSWEGEEKGWQKKRLGVGRASAGERHGLWAQAARASEWVEYGVSGPRRKRCSILKISSIFKNICSTSLTLSVPQNMQTATKKKALLTQCSSE